MKSLLIPLINLLYAHCMFADCFSFKDLYKSDNDSHNQTRTGKWWCTEHNHNRNKEIVSLSTDLGGYRW